MGCGNLLGNPLSANRRILRNDYPPARDTNKRSDAAYKFLLSYFHLPFLRIRYSFYIFLYLFILLIHPRVFYIF